MYNFQADLDEGVWTVPMYARASFDMAVAVCNKVLPREDSEVANDDSSEINMDTTNWGPSYVEVPYFSPPQVR